MLDQISEESSEEKLNQAQAYKLRKTSVVKRVGLALIGLLLFASLGLLVTRNASHSKSRGNGNKFSMQRGQNVPVTVAKVTQKAVPIQLQAIGNVQAYNSVAVTPQVSGQITGIYFKKGQDVKKGQLLFTLDPRTQIAAIQQAEGTLARDMAQVQSARATLNKSLTAVQQAKATQIKDEAQANFTKAQAQRYNILVSQGAIDKNTAQQYSANAASAAATVQADKQAVANAQAEIAVDKASIKNAQGVIAADQAAIDNAKVQLSYTKVYAPIDGQVGDILVTTGNIAQPGSANPVVKINQVRPIQVSFSVPEKYLPEIQKYAQGNKLSVQVTFPNDPNNSVNGVLTFVNNTVDNTTGTIQLMGSFANTQGKLFPGQFVNATLTLTTQSNAIVVPSQAVQQGPNGQFVFVVNTDNNTVKNVPVKTGTLSNGLQVIDQGLQPGQTVVTDGQANLIDGSKVLIKSGSQSGGNVDESF